MTRKHTALLLAIGIVVAAGEVGAAEWKKDGSKGGVTVYTKEVEGSKILQVKGVATIDAPTTDVWDHLVDRKKFLEAMPDVVESKDIGSCGDDCAYYYQKLHHPPLKDRHYVLKVKWKITEDEDGNKTYKRSWNATKAKKPPESGPMLLDKCKGYWKLVPKDGGEKTRITYVNHIEMGGKVPVLLVNNGAVSNAYEFLKNLKKAL